MKKSLTKREEQKSNIINDLHWKSINNLLTKNDVISRATISLVKVIINI